MVGLRRWLVHKFKFANNYWANSEEFSSSLSRMNSMAIIAIRNVASRLLIFRIAIFDSLEQIDKILKNWEIECFDESRWEPMNCSAQQFVRFACDVAESDFASAKLSFISSSYQEEVWMPYSPRHHSTPWFLPPETQVWVQIFWNISQFSRSRQRWVISFLVL